MPDRYPERGQRLVSTAMIPPPADGPPAPPTRAEPADTTCRAQYDPGPNPMPHTRIVRCDLPSGHAGDHAELIDGEIGATWDVPDRLNAEDCRGCTGVPMGYPYVCPGGAGHGPRPADTAPADDVPDELLASIAQAMLPWDEGLTAGINLFEWHRCPTCPRGDQPCSCAGIPWPSEPVRVALSEVWYAARAPLAAEVADLREQLTIVTADRKARTLERDRLVDTLTETRAEIDRHYQDLVKVTGRMVAAHAAQAEAERDRDEAREEVDRSWRVVDRLSRERDQARASLAGAVTANTALAGEDAELRAEVDRLRAAALPEGGQWHTVRGWMNGDRFQTYTSSAEGFLPQTGPTHLRRTWTGPPDAVDETEETGG